MLRVTDQTATPVRHGALPVAGMRRVRWVRVVVRPGGRARCQAVGTGHRLPTVREVSLEAALEMAAGGVPLVIRSANGQPPAASAEN
ncbi:MAG: hypothetical protein ABR540_02650 [Acidimicrobiales bacterium]|nr:hypothetical protein [Actinomycetota bacterium]